MSLVVHSLVEDTDDVNATARDKAIEEDMRARRVLAITSPQLGTFLSKRRTVGYQTNRLS